MLWAIMIALAVLWAVGLVSSYTLGGFIHILILAAVVLLVVRLVQGHRHSTAS
ncbi:MAG: lmo0937 family membrane protein [Deltaproteobacteria bacterium]|nr:lmo0937 family membrane protein [Deltaproteobacteria bacterium]